MNYSSTEIESIGLCICIEAVNDVVNHIMLNAKGISNNSDFFGDILKSSPHRELLIIRLLDFVQEKGDKRLTSTSGSCLDILKKVCLTKSFNNGESISELSIAVENLDEWLYHKNPIKLWLPTLDIETELEVTRLDFLKITGNQCKHNLSRLTRVSNDISKILQQHGYTVAAEHIPLALEDFQEHLQENYFVYYGTWIIELLNNIRWGIQSYLTPTFELCYKKDADNFHYKYEYPIEIKSEIPKQWFWRLMNNVRTGPYVEKFSTSKYLKDKSSLEMLD